MGNRFNKKTNVLLRPPVCRSKGPPTPPAPPPPAICSLSPSAFSLNSGQTQVITTSYDYGGLAPGASVPQAWHPLGGSIGSIVLPQNGVANSGSAVFTAGATGGTFNGSVDQNSPGPGACNDPFTATIVATTPVTGSCCDAFLHSPLSVNLTFTGVPCFDLSGQALTYIGSGIWNATIHLTPAIQCQAMLFCPTGFGPPMMGSFQYQDASFNTYGTANVNFGTSCSSLPWSGSGSISIVIPCPCAPVGFYSCSGTIS